MRSKKDGVYALNNLDPYSMQAPPQSQPTLKNGRRATKCWMAGGQSCMEMVDADRSFKLWMWKGRRVTGLVA